MSQPTTVLVIDDEPQIRKFLRISLVSQGYQVLEAATGADGLSLAALQKPDLLVLDLGLPDMDGLQLISRLREQQIPFPIIVLTARGNWQDKVEGLDAGADDYLVKL